MSWEDGSYDGRGVKKGRETQKMCVCSVLSLDTGCEIH